MQHLLTKAEAAQLMGLSVRKIEMLTKSGDLRVLKLGRRTVRIEAREIDALVDRLAQRASA